VLLGVSTDADGIADFLGCLSILEIKNNQLFKMLSEKIILSSVKPQLSKIAGYHDKHAKFLSALSEGIGNPKVKPKECEKKLSVVGENIENILKQAKEKEEITLEELSYYLQILESTGGAAEYLLIQAETFRILSNEITKLHGMASQQFNELLNEIIQDVEETIYLLESIKKIIHNEQNKNKKKNPLFKYQTPDAWFTPSHSQQHEI
jgi:hypothetical protein